MLERLSKPYADLLKTCATCGGPMPCTLHDEQLREAILHPPEREGLPWDKLERTEIGNVRTPIVGIAPQMHGKYIVACEPGGVWRYDPASGATRGIARYGYAMFAALPLSGASLLIGGESARIVRFDAMRPDGENFEELGLFDADTANSILSMCALPDGTFLIGGESGRIAHFDPVKPEGERVEELVNAYDYDDASSQGKPVSALSQLPDGKLLIASYGRIFRFDVSERREETICALPDTVLAMTPRSDGTYLVASGESVMLLDLAKPPDKRVETIVDFGEHVTSISLLSDTSFLVTGGLGAIARYEIPERELQAWRTRKLDAPDVPPMPE